MVTYACLQAAEARGQPPRPSKNKRWSFVKVCNHHSVIVRNTLAICFSSSVSSEVKVWESVRVSPIRILKGV